MIMNAFNPAAVFGGIMGGGSGGTSPVGGTSPQSATGDISSMGSPSGSSSGGTSSKDANFGSGDFKQKSGGIVKKLIQDFGLTDIQAAGVVGNLGHESGGFKSMQEKSPRGGRGGYGWAQWTGPRRKAFEAWAAKNNLDINSDAANYGYLKYELQNTEKKAIPAVKTASSLEEAVKLFEAQFERAGVKHYESRNKYAKIALDSYKSGSPAGTESAAGAAGTTAAGTTAAGTTAAGTTAAGTTAAGTTAAGTTAAGTTAGTGAASSLPSFGNSDIASSFSSAMGGGGGQIQMGDGTGFFRTPNVNSQTPPTAQIRPQDPINKPETTEPISTESNPTSPFSNYQSKTPESNQMQMQSASERPQDPQSAIAGMQTVVDPVANNIFMWMCDLTGRSLMFGALTQATGQMPFPVIDNSRVI